MLPLDRSVIHAEALPEVQAVLRERLPVHLHAVALPHADATLRILLDVVATYFGDSAAAAAAGHKLLIRKYVSEYAVESLIRLLTALEDDAPAPAGPETAPESMGDV